MNIKTVIVSAKHPQHTVGLSFSGEKHECTSVGGSGPAGGK